MNKQFIVYGHGISSPVLLNCTKREIRKELLRVFGYVSSKPMYRDTLKGDSVKCGYVLTCRGQSPIWATVKECINPFEVTQ